MLCRLPRQMPRRILQRRRIPQRRRSRRRPPTRARHPPAAPPRSRPAGPGPQSHPHAKDHHPRPPAHIFERWTTAHNPGPVDETWPEPAARGDAHVPTFRAPLRSIAGFAVGAGGLRSHFAGRRAARVPLRRCRAVDQNRDRRSRSGARPRGRWADRLGVFRREIGAFIAVRRRCGIVTRGSASPGDQRHPGISTVRSGRADQRTWDRERHSCHPTLSRRSSRAPTAEPPAVRPLEELPQVRTRTIIRAVSDCDDSWPAVPSGPPHRTASARPALESARAVPRPPTRAVGPRHGSRERQ